MLLDLLRDPLFRAVLMVFWLLPCAIQDRRTRRVSNWLTIPLFLVAWPAAIFTDHFPLTFAVFVGVYAASKVEPRFGGADGKLMVGLSAFSPLALVAGVLFAFFGFVVLTPRKERNRTLPGAFWLYIGTLAAAVASVVPTAHR
jgi:Flp pilus assembly protein protease CpaA